MPVVGLAYAGRVQIEFEGEIFRWEAREQTLIGAGISLLTPGTISGNRVTFDPRVAR